MTPAIPLILLKEENQKWLVWEKGELPIAKDGAPEAVKRAVYDLHYFWEHDFKHWYDAEYKPRDDYYERKFQAKGK